MLKSSNHVLIASLKANGSYAKELFFQELIGEFDGRWAAVGAGERVVTFQELFSLIMDLGDIKGVAGDNGCFTGATGDGQMVAAVCFVSG